MSTHHNLNQPVGLINIVFKKSCQEKNEPIKVNYPAAQLRGIKMQNLFPCCHSHPCFRRGKLVPAKAGSANPEKKYWIPASAGMTF
jgi:hypothetical protein